MGRGPQVENYCCQKPALAWLLTSHLNVGRVGCPSQAAVRLFSKIPSMEGKEIIIFSDNEKQFQLSMSKLGVC